MTGPDLSPAVAAVERLMDDTCTITRDPAGTDDAVLNQVTGLLEDNPESLIYSGKCSIRMSAAGVASYITIPLSAPELLAGDVVLVTSTRRDPSLVNQSFTLKKPLYGTMSVSRKATLEEPDEVTETAAEGANEP